MSCARSFALLARAFIEPSGEVNAHEVRASWETSASGQLDSAVGAFQFNVMQTRPGAAVISGEMLQKVFGRMFVHADYYP